MGRKAYTEIGAPPAELFAREFVCRIIRARGNSQYEIDVPAVSAAAVREMCGSPGDGPLQVIAAMPPRFRNTVYAKRGGFVVITVKEVVLSGAESGVEADHSAEPEPEPEHSAVPSAVPDPAKPKKKGKKHGKNPLKEKLLSKKPSESPVVVAPPPPNSTFSNTTVAEITNIVVGPRAWEKMPYWPAEYVTASKGWDESSDEEGYVPPKDLPSSDEDVEYY